MLPFALQLTSFELNLTRSLVSLVVLKIALAIAAFVPHFHIF